MSENSNYYIWNKGDHHVFGNDKYFNSKEFTCKCTFSTCVEQRINRKLIDDLISLRKMIGEPLIVTSGYRCTRYQEKIRNEGVSTVVAKKSTHELGDAADIKASRMNIATLVSFASKVFKAIGTANTFIHVDLRDDKTRRWIY